MSEMKEGLLAQIAGGEAPDVGKVFREMFKGVPTVDYATERQRFIEQITKEQEKARAESQSR